MTQSTPRCTSRSSQAEVRLSLSPVLACTEINQTTDDCPLTDILVGVPGAFTPPCSSQVPGYVSNAEAFSAKGVAGIYIVAVNDAFTTQAWKEKLGASSPLVHFCADDTGLVSRFSFV